MQIVMNYTKTIHVIGCYHSALAIGALYKIAKEEGMNVEGYGFSETQNGKSGADRVSGMLKNKVNNIT